MSDSLRFVRRIGTVVEVGFTAESGRYLYFDDEGQAWAAVTQLRAGVPFREVWEWAKRVSHRPEQINQRWV